MSEDDPGRVLRDLPAPEPWNDEEAAVQSLRRTLRDAIDAVPTDGLAIAFSGGVDSAILAALLDAPLFVAGFPDSHDVEAARSGAAALGRQLTTIELSHETLVDAIPRVVAATGRTTAMDVAIALPLVLTAERVAPEGLKRLAVGQGADELFGGYAKVAKAPEDPRVEADSVAGARREVLAELAEDIDRDLAGIRSAGIEPVCPYLTDAVVEAALRLPGPMLLRKEERKWALRRAASPWLPAELVERDKKAMQYGSLVSRELDRLARQEGFKRRMDDHVDRYIASLLE